MRGMSAATWWALMGPVPEPEPTGYITLAHDRARTLSAPSTIGPFTIRSGDRPLAEYLRLEPNQLAGCVEWVSWPLIVEGNQTNDEASLARLLGPPLRRLAALLSLAWDEPWHVRTAPTVVDRLPPEVPEPWPQPEPCPEPLILEPERVSLPEWVVAGWATLESDSAVRAALVCWHEGIMMARRHPSFALVAFIGAIEQVARTSNQRPTSSRRRHRVNDRDFWAAVSAVATDDEVGELKRGAGNIHGLRDVTAHGYDMHGIETTYGAILWLHNEAGSGVGFLVDSNDPVQQFMFRSLPRTMRIAAILIRRGPRSTDLTASGPGAA
jgi:hypothetical protein